MQIGRFHEELQGFSTADSLDDVTELLRLHASRLGFEWFVYALDLHEGGPSSRLALANGYPGAWIEHYFREGFLGQDPVMTYCREHIVPTEWSSLGPAALGSRVMREAPDFGLSEGLSAPLHGPRGDLGVLSFATGAELRSARKRTRRALPYVHLLAGYVHEALRRVVAAEGARMSRPLSPRERECLLWVAEGKTSWEIGVILKTSERTVNFHLQNACAKLGVSNRQHAVAKAMLLGLLRSPPLSDLTAERARACPLISVA
ncbi:helix-turn-helix transcriptional regulator [Sorangium sp. So ce1024]|uniref:helix-turn-helix transcriptional regulator n=1 Tax=unclassified Sorangium TaxID=2621164 RepID=UPI003EFF0B4F